MVSANLKQFTLATNTPTERVSWFIYLSFPYLVLILNKEETMLDGKPMNKDIWIKEFVLSTHFPSTVAKESFLLCSKSNGALHNQYDIEQVEASFSDTEYWETIELLFYSIIHISLILSNLPNKEHVLTSIQNHSPFLFAYHYNP